MFIPSVWIALLFFRPRRRRSLLHCRPGQWKGGRYPSHLRRPHSPGHLITERQHHLCPRRILQI